MGLLYKKEPDPYYYQINRLQRMLNMVQPGTDEYDKILMEIDKIQNQKQQSKILHRRVHMDLKKPLVAGGVFAALLGWNHYLDSHGDLLMGNAKKTSENLLTSLTRVFTGIRFW